MLEHGKVSNWQAAFALPVLIVTTTAILFVPAITYEAAERDGWISLLVVATFYGLIVALVGTMLALRFPNKTVIEYAPQIFGTIIGKLIGVFYVIGFIHFNAVIIREFSDFLMNAFMPETPRIVFVVVLLLLSVMAVKGGIEVICRAGEWVFFIFLLSIFLISSLVINQADFSNLLPILENGIKPVIKGGLTPSAFRGEIILVILMFFPYIHNQKKTGWYLAGAVILIGIVLAVTSMVTISVFNVLTNELTFPYFALARFISIADFIERMESLIMIMWVAGVTVKVTAFYYAAVLGAAQLFNLQDYRPLTFPIGLVLASWSVIFFEDSMEVSEWLNVTFPPYACFFEFIIPLVLLLVAVIRKKGEKQNA